MAVQRPLSLLRGSFFVCLLKMNNLREKGEMPSLERENMENMDIVGYVYLAKIQMNGTGLC